MSLNINLVVIGGNVVRDPVTKFLDGGSSVANFTLAISRKTKDGKESTCFIDVESWGKTAEIVGQYVKKGAPLIVEGRLTQSTFEKDGVKVSKTRVSATNLNLLSNRSQGTDGATKQESCLESPGNDGNRVVKPMAKPKDDEPPF